MKRIPQFAVFQITGVEFPIFIGIVDALLQALALLVFGYVQKKFNDGGAGFAQQAFKIVDVANTAFGFGLVYPAFYARYQHVFVVAAVKNHQFAVARHHLVDAP